MLETYILYNCRFGDVDEAIDGDVDCPCGESEIVIHGLFDEYNAMKVQIKNGI